MGRYALFDAIASGGMASVHLGRLLGPVGFSRTVAIKRLHENLAQDPEFVAMFLDEARLAARIRHPNVVPTLDVVTWERELLLVMEYVSGASLSRLLGARVQGGTDTPIGVVVDIMIGVLNGLDAAHRATNEQGEPLQIVHRDISPHNILVGADGVARVLDFGIAKAAGCLHSTRPNQIKGRLRYMSPESISLETVTSSSDVYSAAVVLWEALSGRRLFDGDNDGNVVQAVMNGAGAPPSSLRPNIPPELDRVVMRGLRLDPRERHASARAMAEALEAAVAPVNRTAVGAWVLERAGVEIADRERRVASVERESNAGSELLRASSAIDSLATGSSRAETDAASNSTPSVSRVVTTRQQKGLVPSRRSLFLALALGAACALLLAFGLASFRARPEAPPRTSAKVVSATATVPEPPSVSAAATPAVDRADGPQKSDTPELGERPAVTAHAPKPVHKLGAKDRIYRRD